MIFLNDHPDFPALVRIVAERLQLLPVLVLKDYWAKRVLRAVAADAQLQDQVIFKGGTSLSKGWKVIDRFSEDVDLLLTGPQYGDMPAGGGARERLLKRGAFGGGSCHTIASAIQGAHRGPPRL